MTDKEYEVLERFSIIAESEGDMVAFQMIKQKYGSKWCEWLITQLYERGK